MTKDTDWCSLIRQKINNLYTRHFDKEVILHKDYMDLLKTPYNLYYRWIKGSEFKADELVDVIENSIYQAAELKCMYQTQKMQLSWSEYKTIIEGFLRKIFDNCKPIEEYEDENLTNKYIYEFANEDNPYISYFCNSLEFYMLNFQKEYYGLKRGRDKQYKRCKECGTLIEKTNNRLLYCGACKRKMELQRYKKYNQKRNNHN